MLFRSSVSNLVRLTTVYRLPRQEFVADLVSRSDSEAGFRAYTPQEIWLRLEWGGMIPDVPLQAATSDTCSQPN
jgi:hypothetical protein